MHDSYPAPDTVHPVPLPDGSRHEGTVFLKPVITHPRWQVGEYSYASAHKPPQDWAFHLAPYLYDFSPEKLIIGKFCQIADGVQFITASANHRYDGFTSYPLAIFGGGPAAGRPSMPDPGPDTVIGHDVWLGQGVRVLPGSRIGSGCIIGSGAVVSGDIPPYSIVAGNPARVVRKRFSEDVIGQLLDLSWWDWPIERILKEEAALCSGKLDLLDR
ncbi:CatB-related O-acetyltransferase [Nioella aestuarii]|uniref:CatB-related O-acetyltransferase n=1 Tax=Nioella aestuarii TaxID=1662864 RepID=UPI003D7F3D0F